MVCYIIYHKYYGYFGLKELSLIHFYIFYIYFDMIKLILIENDVKHRLLTHLIGYLVDCVRFINVCKFLQYPGTYEMIICSIIPRRSASLCNFDTNITVTHSNTICTFTTYSFALYHELEVIHILKSRSHMSHRNINFLFMLNWTLFALNSCQIALKITGFSMPKRRTSSFSRKMLSNDDIAPKMGLLELKQAIHVQKRHINRIQDC